MKCGKGNELQGAYFQSYEIQLELVCCGNCCCAGATFLRPSSLMLCEKALPVDNNPHGSLVCERQGQEMPQAAAEIHCV